MAIVVVVLPPTEEIMRVVKQLRKNKNPRPNALLNNGANNGDTNGTDPQDIVVKGGKGAWLTNMKSKVFRRHAGDGAEREEAPVAV